MPPMRSLISSKAAAASSRAAWADKRPLLGDDVARAVLFAVSAPEHVNVNEILIRPTDQPT